MSAGKRQGCMIAGVSMSDDDVAEDLPRIGDLPPCQMPINIHRYTMRETLSMPAWMVQDVLDELEPDLQAVLDYQRMLRDALQIRLDIEAAGERHLSTLR